MVCLSTGLKGDTMRRFLLFFITLVIVLYLGLSWFFASIVIDYRPQEEARDAEWAAIYAPEWDVPVSETVEIISGNNILIADVYDNPVDNDCAVMIVHGLGGERALVRQYGTLFWELGCDVMSYDFAPRNNDVFLTYGYTEKDDLENVLTWFGEYTELPTSSIGIWAESYGAATALQMLPQQSDVAWVIADSSYASMSSILNEQAIAQFGEGIRVMLPGAFFMIEQRADFTIDDVSPVDAISDVTVPILLIHSQSDELINPANSQAIYDAANPVTTRLVFTDWGSAHTQSYYDDKAAYSAIIYEFLREFAPAFGNQSSIEQGS